jgi:hypothetical protein
MLHRGPQLIAAAAAECIPRIRRGTLLRMGARPTLEQSLPADAARATLIGRAWLPGAGPTTVVVRADRPARRRARQ